MNFYSPRINNYVDISSSLDTLSKRWYIDPIIRDLHLGKRTDVKDYPIKVNQVTFHIPYLTEPSLFLLWGCLWPDCHNCCNKQGRLPLTCDDMEIISKELGYANKSSFLKNETYITSWDNDAESNSQNSQIITTLTMVNLKRKNNENENDDGIPISCRFLDDKGSCTIHPSKPGVCWLYPFFSWSQYDNNCVSIHASYQLTGDCPGFSLSSDIGNMSSCLDEYSRKIYAYNMNVNTTVREGYGCIDIAG